MAFCPAASVPCYRLIVGAIEKQHNFVTYRDGAGTQSVFLRGLRHKFRLYHFEQLSRLFSRRVQSSKIDLQLVLFSDN